MSNQPTLIRPRFRLPSMSRMPEGPPIPGPQPPPVQAPPPLLQVPPRPIVQVPMPPPPLVEAPLPPIIQAPSPPPPPPLQTQSASTPAPAPMPQPQRPPSPMPQPQRPLEPQQPQPQAQIQSQESAPTLSRTTPDIPIVSVQVEPPQAALVKPSGSSSLPASPRPKVASRNPTPLPSPKMNVKPSSPSQSPKTKPSSPPPLPLPPSSQLKPFDNPEPEPVKPLPQPVVTEPKTVLVQEEPKKGAGQVHMKGTEEANRKGVESIMTQNGRQASTGRNKHGDEEVRMRVITIAGENKGAYMELASSHSNNKKHEKDEKEKVGYKANGAEGDENESEREGSSSKSNGKDKMGPMKAFVNSNVQSVNNSIMFNSSCAHNDPGVHLAISRKPLPNKGFHSKTHPNGHHD
ncbi:uncharacterized protein LOC143880746 [Tasmannia lanceolata]|uniref:uncharacterized protein LOC143880746 n=1 Tax=Tasmannia lanceolata TaxID=3420 RepID=UPI00406470AB